MAVASRSHFILVAIALAVAASVFMSGCIRQTVASDCNTIPADQSYMKALCYQKAAVYQSVYGGTSAKANAVACCHLRRAGVEVQCH